MEHMFYIEQRGQGMSVTSQRPTGWRLAGHALMFHLRRPWIYCIAAWLLAWRFLPPTFVSAHEPEVKEILLASLNVAAIAFGFIMTAKSILIALANDRVMRDLRALGVAQQLIPIFGACVWFYFLVVAWSTVFLFGLNVERLEPFMWHAMVVWLVLAVGSLAATARLFKLYEEILRQQLL